MAATTTRALLDLGEALGPTLSADTSRRLRDDPTALAEIVALAARHQLRGNLWLALCRHGLCAPLPDQLRRHLPPGHPATVLEDGWTHESRHGAELLVRSRAMIAALNAAGIEPMLLKGMALVMGGILPEPGQRWMVDIDLLVHPEQLAAAIAVMESLGYRPRPGSTAPHHAPAMAGEVEIHFDMVVPALQAALPTDRAWRIATAVAADGLRYWLPSPEDAIVHVALHGQHSNHVQPLARLPLRPLSDLAHLRRRHDRHLDWPALRRRAAAAGHRFAFDTHLYQCCRVFRQDWPLTTPPPWPVRLHWRLCLLAAAHPHTLGRLLFARLEIASAFAPAAGRPALARLSAHAALALRLLGKYKWRIGHRLMGRRR